MRSLTQLALGNIKSVARRVKRASYVGDGARISYLPQFPKHPADFVLHLCRNWNRELWLFLIRSLFARMMVLAFLVGAIPPVIAGRFRGLRDHERIATLFAAPLRDHPRVIEQRLCHKAQSTISPIRVYLWADRLVEYSEPDGRANARGL